MLRATISRAVADAQANAEGRGSQGGYRAQAEAMAAALRIVEGLPGAIEGAISRPLASLSDPRASDPGGALGQGDQRAQIAASRVAMGAVTRAAAQALDLVLAQARAAYPARGLPPPVFSVSVDAPIAVIERAGEPAAAYRERMAETARVELLARAETARIILAREIRAHGPAPVEAPKPSDGAAERVRAGALKLLEEDVLRIEQLLSGLIQDR